MKRLITILFLSCVTLSKLNAQATNTSEALAERIAQRMKDTLQLTTAQKNAIYEVNMELHRQKMTARQQYSADAELLEAIQKVENTRDSRYSSIFSEEKFIIYKEKKSNLVNNN